jgi:hypothetical protein
MLLYLYVVCHHGAILPLQVCYCICTLSVIMAQSYLSEYATVLGKIAPWWQTTYKYSSILREVRLHHDDTTYKYSSILREVRLHHDDRQRTNTVAYSEREDCVIMVQSYLSEYATVFVRCLSSWCNLTSPSMLVYLYVVCHHGAILPLRVCYCICTDNVQIQ